MSENKKDVLRNIFDNKLNFDFFELQVTSSAVFLAYGFADRIRLTLIDAIEYSSPIIRK